MSDQNSNSSYPLAIIVGGSGRDGTIGPPGPRGPIGPQGADGPRGATGAAGPQGAQGPQGATGPRGTAGTDGARGPQGAVGPAGDVAEFRVSGTVMQWRIPGASNWSDLVDFDTFWETPDVPPPPTGTLLGVGSVSSSLAEFPKTGNVTSGNWFVDPTNGSDSRSGTSTSTAFKTLERAFSSVGSGQTILVMAGTLRPSSRYDRTSSWGSTVKIFNYGSARPVIDGVNLGLTNGAARVLNLKGSNEHWKGFELINCHTGFNEGGAVTINGSNYKIEDLWVHNCRADAVYVFGSGGYAENITIQDCRVWAMGDGSSSNTNVQDGITATGSSRNINIIRCLVANAPDDGIDFWSSYNVKIRDCVVFRPGYYANGVRGGDGNCFKLGGGTPGASGVGSVIGSMAIDAASVGFDWNETQVTVTGNNNTAVGNGNYGYHITGSGHPVNNNISDNRVYTAGASGSNNSWQASNFSTGFASPSQRDYSLMPGSSGIGTGTSGTNMGASTIALQIAKDWLSTGVAKPPT